MLVSLLFGANFVLNKEVMEHGVDARAWAFFRLAAAAVFLLPVLLVQRHRFPPRRLWLPLTLASALGVFANQALFIEGLKRTTSEHSAVINSSIPVLTLLFAVFIRQERFRWSKVMAIATALTGVLILLKVDQWGSIAGGGASDSAAETMMFGDTLTVFNATSFALFVVMMRRLNKETDPLGATVFCFLVAVPMMLLFAWPEINGANLAATLAPGVWQMAAYIVLGGTVLTYFLNNWALQYAESSQVTLYIYLQPVVATSLGIAMDKPLPGSRFFVAGVLVGAGLFVESIAAARRRRLRLASVGQPVE